MTARILMIVAIVLVLSCGLVRAGAPERYAVVVSGASGGQRYAENYDRWRGTLVTALREKLRFPAANITVLAEKAVAESKVASRETVRDVLTSLRARLAKDDLLLIVLIGHGTFDGADAKFNLVGPDLAASAWNDLIRGITARVIVVNTTGASFPFLERLSAQGRVVITATDSAAQRYDTVFPEFFAQALDDPAGDLDKNGRISIFEAFAFASDKVRQWYEQRGQLSTERPVLDDSGDGIGKEAGAPGPDGALARRTYLDADANVARGDDPALADLLRRRAQLEAQVEELKAKKETMEPEAYQTELERLLIDLAKVSQQIRKRS
ncbi:MAG: hypothetical protein HYX76_16070 [Acidobacteria bacterium]|nr:hypothetical protein [Acidobacteriota bacterium]